MELVKLDNLKELDRLVGGEFLQAEFWSELLISEGEAVEYWGVKEDDSPHSSSGEVRKILAAAVLIKKKLFGPFFYYYAPRGPRGEKAAIGFLLNELKKEKFNSLNSKAKAIFLRIEPEEKISSVNLKKTIDLQPKKTLWLDLSLSEEELLKAMHQKTRYNIRLSEKKGVVIREGGGTAKDFSEFWRLMSLTSERDAFRIHNQKHYKNLLGASNNIKLYFAQFEGKNIAAGLFCFFNDRVTYMHGASDNEARNLMAPYLLQWEVIKTAKKEGYKYYDFYGIDEKKWPGVTRFKGGFGGVVKEYPGTYDFIFRPFVYNLYELLRKLRRSL
jgi:lipid II:glycine glycyltransferase (peptidoglycan interpeptide bridge formation enzyme)